VAQAIHKLWSLSEHNREKVEPVSTMTSADGTTIDYDAYGNGPTVIFVGAHLSIAPLISGRLRSPSS
jgi:hypothetical protein